MDLGFEIGPAAWAFGGAVVVAIFNQGVTLWKERSQRRDDQQRERTRSALLLAAALETFAQACASTIDRLRRDGDEAVRFRMEVSVSASTMPQLTLPADVDWRWIPPALANDILSLRLLVATSRHAVDEAYEPAGMGYSFAMASVVQRHARDRGARAWELAVSLRHECQLPAMVLAGKDDFRPMLKAGRAQPQ